MVWGMDDCELSECNVDCPGFLGRGKDDPPRGKYVRKDAKVGGSNERLVRIFEVGIVLGFHEAW